MFTCLVGRTARTCIKILFSYMDEMGVFQDIKVLDSLILCPRHAFKALNGRGSNCFLKKKKARFVNSTD